MTVVSIPACAILAGISTKLAADSVMNHALVEERFSATFHTSHSSHVSKAGSKVKQKVSPCYIVTTSSTHLDASKMSSIASTIEGCWTPR